MSRSAILYDTQLTITAIDPDGKKFDRGASLLCPPPLPPTHAHVLPVSRIVASSPTDSTRILLDVAVDIYPLTVGQSLNFKLADSLAPDGQEEDAREAWRREGPSLADEAAYVMYGKVSAGSEWMRRAIGRADPRRGGGQAEGSARDVCEGERAQRETGPLVSWRLRATTTHAARLQCLRAWHGCSCSSLA
jgi:hypothetical protein